MKRREFLNWAGIGLLASNFSVVLAACSDTSTDSNNSSETTSNTPGAEEFLLVGTIQELQDTGFLLDKNSHAIVFQDSNNQVLAVSSLCTHRGCTVEWRKASNILFCPCHDSEFAVDGQVLDGPADTPLSTYEIKEEDGKILVKVI